MQTSDKSFVYSYQQGAAKLLGRIGVKDLDDPGRLIWWSGYLHLGLSMLMMAVLIGFAFGEVLFGNQSKISWSESPILLFNSTLFFLFWPMHLVAKNGLGFYRFLKENHPDKLDCKSQTWSNWVQRLAKLRIGTILPFVLLFIAALIAYFSDNPLWWDYARLPVIGLMLAYQVYHIWELRKFRRYIEVEMELIRGEVSQLGKI